MDELSALADKMVVLLGLVHVKKATGAWLELGTGAVAVYVTVLPTQGVVDPEIAETVGGDNCVLTKSTLFELTEQGVSAATLMVSLVNPVR